MLKKFIKHCTKHRDGIRHHIKHVKLKHSGIENVTLLTLIALFLVLLVPIAFIAGQDVYTGHVVDIQPTHDEITAMAAASNIDPNDATFILWALVIVFLIPIELILREKPGILKKTAKSSRRKKKR